MRHEDERERERETHTRRHELSKSPSAMRHEDEVVLCIKGARDLPPQTNGGLTALRNPMALLSLKGGRFASKVVELSLNPVFNQYAIINVREDPVVLVEIYDDDKSGEGLYNGAGTCMLTYIHTYTTHTQTHMERECTTAYMYDIYIQYMCICMYVGIYVYMCIDVYMYVCMCVYIGTILLGSALLSGDVISPGKEKSMWLELSTVGIRPTDKPPQILISVTGLGDKTVPLPSNGRPLEAVTIAPTSFLPSAPSSLLTSAPVFTRAAAPLPAPSEPFSITPTHERKELDEWEAKSAAVKLQLQEAAKWFADECVFVCVGVYSYMYSYIYSYTYQYIHEYMNISIFIYIHIYTGICIYTYIQIYICIYMLLYIYVYIFIYICVYICYFHIYIYFIYNTQTHILYRYMCVCICVCVCVCVCVYLCVCACVRVFIYIHTHITGLKMKMW